MERLADDLAEDSELTDMRHQALAMCLDKLRDVDRQPVDLRYYSETSVQHVAEQVGRSTDAVYKAINRIRWSLLDCIQRRLRGEGT
ncbi:hypothetical protein NL533_32385, partial [Klebsiella pneumoniae]|nr:hypothetical protein [Klebsiella pneumoniae]